MPRRSSAALCARVLPGLLARPTHRRRAGTQPSTYRLRNPFTAIRGPHANKIQHVALAGIFVYVGELGQRVGLLTKFAKGAAAGLAGAAAMHAFRIAWERTAPDRVRDGIFGFDREADIDSAQWINGLVFREPLPIETAARLGLTLHYVYGALLGAAYGTARGCTPRISNAWGVPAGVVLWLAADELPITLSGISNPVDRSLASHLSALAAHLLYATTIENILRYW